MRLAAILAVVFFVACACSDPEGSSKAERLFDEMSFGQEILDVEADDADGGVVYLVRTALKVPYDNVELPAGYEEDPDRPPSAGKSGDIEAAYALGPDPGDSSEECEIQLLFNLVSVSDPEDGAVMSVGIWCDGA